MNTYKLVPYEYSEKLLYPVIPAFVVAGSRERVGGMLAAWWTQLSFHPMLIGVAIAPERYTYRLISEIGKFSINLIEFKYVESMPYIGDVSERFLRNKIVKAGFRVGWDDEYEVPFIKEAAGYMILKLLERRPYGDHDLFVGEVLKAYASDAFSNGMWDLTRYKPLMYLGRTRRPAKVKRVYLTFGDVVRRELEFAGGELKKYSRIRYEILNKLSDIYKRDKYLPRERLLQEIKNLLSEYGLDGSDTYYYLEELSRSI